MGKLETNVATKLAIQAIGVTTLGLVSVTSAACGGTSNTDAGGTAADAHVASGEDASGGYSCPVTAGCVVASRGEAGTTPADFSCRGTQTAPTPGADTTATFRLSVFGQDGQIAPGTRVQFFRENVISETCAAPGCTEFTTGSDGTYGPVTTHGGGWYAYRVFERTGGTRATTFTDSVQYNELAPTAAGGTLEGNAVAFSTIDLIPLSLGLERAPGTTILAGRVQDCTGEDVGGAFVRAFRSDGTEIAEASEVDALGPHYRYFRRIGADSNPSNEQPYTNYEGLYAAMNIPVGADLIRVEAWGRRTGDDAPVLLGCEGVLTLADGVTILNIQPLRSDYDASHPCARYAE